MKKNFNLILKCLLIPFLLSFILSCSREQLQPLPPPGNSGPVVFITANLDGDSIYLAGGVNSYAGSSSVFDTLTHRRFIFTLSSLPFSLQSYFKISVNNYDTILGDLQSDLDSTFFPGSRNYQLTNSPNDFTPLNVSVDWIDSTGVQYRSYSIVQTAVFTITSVEDIVFNNITYKKVTAEFECRLNYLSSIIQLTNGRASILFSGN